MDVMQAIKERRSIRSFTDYKIPDETIENLIEALLWAPSAGNLQSRKFYFIRDDVLKMRLAVAALNQTFIAEAPLVALADGAVPVLLRRHPVDGVLDRRLVSALEVGVPRREEGHHLIEDLQIPHLVSP